PVPQSAVFHASQAACHRTRNAAFRRESLAIRQGLPHQFSSHGARSVEKRKRPGMADASEDKRLDRLSGCGSRNRFLPERSFSRRIVSVVTCRSLTGTAL